MLHFALSLLLLISTQTRPISLSQPASLPSGSRVVFNEDGIAMVDGRPFFPIGLFTYDLSAEVLAEIHELQCNTILNGFKADQLDLIHQHGLMAVCFTDPAWIKAAQHHPALLAWYLTDEPEGHGISPETARNKYLELKAADPNHPIGLCHFLFDALAKYKDACDFTMTDVYPVTAQRDVPLVNVGIHMDEARRVHGEPWPNWTYIQVFGGPETDGGKWAVPLPHEIRFMAYQALVHRATAILYFAYWPRQPRMWQSIAALNREIQQIVPRLVTPGIEFRPEVDSPSIQIRGRGFSTYRYPGAASTRPELAEEEKSWRAQYESKHLPSGLVIAVNTSPKFVQTTIRLKRFRQDLRETIEGRDIHYEQDGSWTERFPPYGVHVYEWGDEPHVRLAGESPGR